MNIVERMKTRSLATLLLLILVQSSVIAALSDGGTYRIIFRSAMDAPSADPDFQENPQRYFELYTMNGDGSDIRRVTHNTYYENQPDVSPDGKTVVCSVHLNASRASGTDPGWEIALIDMETGEMTLLTDNDYLDYGAHWNHDGTEIVYVSDSAHRDKVDVENQVPLRYDIYTMKADGSDKTQLTFAGPGDVNADPSFSFDAPSRILYIHSEEYSGAFDLYAMDSDGGNKALLRGHDEQLLAMNDPMFSPDGTRIVFGAKVRESAEGNPIYNVFTVDPSGGDLTRITADDGESDVIPQYSPDGGWISYYTYVWEDGGNTHRIRVVISDGTDERTLSTYPWESDPSWYAASQEETAQLTDDTPPGGTDIPGFWALSILVAILCFLGLKRRTNRLDAANATKSHTH
jgi:Tol biopolymer transport system component